MNYQYIKDIKKGSYSKCSLYILNYRKYAIKKNIEKLNFHSCDLREYLALAIIRKHPNIVNLLDIYFDENNIFSLVYDYYPITLFQFIDSHNFEKRSFLLNSFCTQLFSAVHHIHSNNIIHTDIKNENILVNLKNNDFQIKLIDFGTSCIDEYSVKVKYVSTYTIRAPEVYNINAIYTNKIDIWSCGVIIYNFYYAKDVIEINPNIEEFSHLRLNQAIDFYNDLDIFIKDKKLYELLSKMIEICPISRYDIKELINLYENLYDVKVYTDYYIKYPKFRSSYKINKKLIDFNNFISTRINDIYLKNLNYSFYLLNSCFFIKDIDLISSWYLNYILNYYEDIDYKIESLIPLFNSYFKKIFFEDKIVKNCRRLLINSF